MSRNGGSSSRERDEPQGKLEPDLQPVTKTEVEVAKTAPTNNGHGGNGHSGDAQCLHCQSQRVRRAKREGLMERFYYPLFSKYPYRCSDCGTRFMNKGRG